MDLIRRPAFCLRTYQSLANHRMASTFQMNIVNAERHKDAPKSRPLSPHLSIYRVQLTSSLSILHRITGLGASAVLYGGGIGALFSTSTSFPELVQLIQQNVPHIILLGTKTAVGGAFVYHTLNGIRHLVWDAGYGFQLKHLYLSGYMVIALTAIGTAAIFIEG